ncbi:X-linked interleukin-1 receptor accessory protein-like 2 [Notechis scutatus]|uniref:X-linked interleukin-1 receptor accessory protein-like 2 n=1 Tax=Notechis scutatus TaxID=8663 RepID=A0A6J1UHX6_9SAUR|nr:X-linked interleukin-1 receptor accessory protein-like 2 [Notechis scutatus]
MGKLSGEIIYSLSMDGCIDWLVDLKKYMALAGEPVRVKCALFYSYIRTNYSMAQSTGLRLMWYKNKGDFEEPIIFSEGRINKDEDSIWFHTAEVQDSGFYTCVLRNSTYCMKVSMSLTVAENELGLCYNSTIRYLEKSEITRTKVISCPDTEDYKMGKQEPDIIWYKQNSIHKSGLVNSDTLKLIPLDAFMLNRNTIPEIKMTALVTNRPPQPLYPVENQTSLLEVQLGQPLNVVCKAFFGFSGESGPMIYWTRGEKFIEELESHVKEGEIRLLKEHLGEKIVELTLIFDIVKEADLANYTCHVENRNGKKQASIILRKRDLISRIELAGGLGAIFLLLVLLVTIYKCYNIELMLCYRQMFGGDEAMDDNKEYDAYLSYTKVDPDTLDRDNREEEQFVLEILPDVLEKQYGYKLFIPDRDLIPTGTYLEDLTRCIEQSRRLLIVLTPDYVLRRGWSIFEMENRLHNMLLGGEIKVIFIECPQLRGKVNYQEVESLKHSIKLFSVIPWKGPQSNKPNSKFWKHLLYEMPAKKKEVISRRQVLDSAEQGLFADLQTVPSIAVTDTSATLISSQADLGDYPPTNTAQMRHYCRGYDYNVQSATLPLAAISSNHHTYCNIPLTLLNGQLPLNSSVKDVQDFHRNPSLLPLSTRELSFTSDIW